MGWVKVKFDILGANMLCMQEVLVIKDKLAILSTFLLHEKQVKPKPAAWTPAAWDHPGRDTQGERGVYHQLAGARDLLRHLPCQQHV